MTDRVELQPVSDIQLNQLVIEWVPRDSIRPNKYNPNKMSWQDRMLLRQSILEDGWTQPVVTLTDRTIVDGEQRWTVSGLALKPSDVQAIIDKMEKRRAEGHPESDSIIARLHEALKRLEAAVAAGVPGTLAALTGGLVPITRVDFGDDAHKMISTIRHNRARGTHGIDQMSLITQDLVALGLDLDDLEVRLGMDDEEIQRLIKATDGQMDDMTLMASTTDFSPSIKMAHMSELPEEQQKLYNRSVVAGAAMQDYQQALKARADMIEQRKAEAVEASGGSMTQIDKDELEQAISKEAPAPAKPAMPNLKKLMIFITPAENTLINQAFGANLATGLVIIADMLVNDADLRARFIEKLSV